MKTKGLPQEILKLIACITMLIDHFGATIVAQLAIPGVVPLYFACRIVGRLAFPIYCFLLVEGMQHTRDPKKYLLRLGIGILLAELPFDLIFENGITWQYQSVMVTLTLGAVMLLCMGKVENRWMKPLIVIPFAILAELCNCDYGGWGLAMIGVFALFDRPAPQFLGLLLINGLMNSAGVNLFGIRVSVQLFAVLAMIPIACYSGVKLTRSKALQWGFYLFYPVHLLILWLIQEFMM